MPLETRPLHPTLACEVVGLRAVGNAGRRNRRRAARALRAIRRPGVSPSGAERGRAGGVLRRCSGRWSGPCAAIGPRPAVPEVTVLSNLKDGHGRPIGGLGDGELRMAFRPVLHGQAGDRRRALCARAARPSGGETFWVDLRAAYAGLPRQLRADDHRQARRLRLYKAARRLWARQRPEHFRGGQAADPAGDPRAGPRPPGDRRPLALPQFDDDDRHRLHGHDLRHWRCSTRSTRAPPATNSSTPTNGRSATSWCGTTASRCTAAPRSTRRPPADEADDDEPRPAPPRHARRQARGSRGRDADSSGRTIRRTNSHPDCVQGQFQVSVLPVLPPGWRLPRKASMPFAGVVGQHVAGHHLGGVAVGVGEVELGLAVERLLADRDGERRFARRSGGRARRPRRAVRPPARRG